MPHKGLKKSIDHHQLLLGSITPSLEDIKLSLGTKAAKQLDKLLLQNQLPLAEIYFQLGETLKNDLKKDNALIGYALAAREGGITGLKACEAALGLIDDVVSRQGLWRPDLEALTPIFIDKKNQIQSTPWLSIKTSRGDLNEALQAAESLQEMILAKRLDLFYAVLKKCESLDKIHPSDSPLIENIRVKSLNFLEAVLDVKGSNKIHDLMKERELKKYFNPEFIPGPKVSKFTKTINPYQASTRAGYLWRRSTETVLAIQNKKMLALNERAKIKDEDENAVMLTAAERDKFRVLITNGKFQQRNYDNSFLNFDSSHYTSHLGRGFAAFVLNNQGEFSVFNHTGGDIPFFHSSLNAQAPIFSAGEIKIEKGELKELTSHSGHYQPDKDNMLQLLQYFQNKNLDLSQVIVNLYYIDKEAQEARLKKFNAYDLILYPKDTPELNENYPSSNNVEEEWAKFDEFQNNKASSLESGGEDWAKFDSEKIEHSSSTSVNTTDKEPSLSGELSEPDEWAHFDSTDEESPSTQEPISYQSSSSSFWAPKDKKTKEISSLPLNNSKKLYK